MSNTPASDGLGQVSSELLQAIVEQAPDPMIFSDRDGAIRIWNRAAETVFGYSAAEALGRSLDLIIPERFRDAHWKAFHHSVESGQTKYAGRVLTTRSNRKDGAKLYVDLSFGLVTDGAGTVIGVLAIGRDCTTRQLAGREG